jgi:hypothetical protein
MRALLGAGAIVATLSVPAEAVSVRDILELARAGLGDEVLLALVEVDRTIFSLTPAEIRELKDAGVSEKVIAAMIRSGRTPVPQPEVAPSPQPLESAPEPQVVVIDHHEPPRTIVEQVVVPVPVYVPVVTTPRHRSVRVEHRPGRQIIDHTPGSTLPPRFISPTVPPTQVAPRRQPEYWGWGGKPRPDGWKEPKGR